MRLATLLALLLAAAPAPATPPAAKAPADRMQLAFVLLGRPALPEARAVAAAFKEIAPPSEGPLTAAPGKPGERGVEALELAVGKGASLILALMPAPVPDHEADEAFGRSYSRGTVKDGKLAEHKAHLVAVFHDEPGRSRRDGLARFTWLLAAVAKASGAIGVYWGDAGATHEASFFVALAATTDQERMLPLWCGFEVVRDGADRVSLLTLGMEKQLGIMDLRVTAPVKGLGGTIASAYDLLAYATRRGSAVPDGDTVGRDEVERLEVRWEPSPADPKVKVWRVDFP